MAPAAVLFLYIKITDTNRTNGRKETIMAEFTPINTQEEFDAALKERLKRDREAQAKKFEGWTSPEDLQKKMSEFERQIKELQDAAAASEKTLAEKDAKIAEGAKYRTDLEKTRIALAAGLKIDYADRLRGENADEWKKDAEVLAKDFAVSHRTAPLGDPEPAQSKNVRTDKRSAENAAFKNMLADLSE